MANQQISIFSMYVYIIDINLQNVLRLVFHTDLDEKIIKSELYFLSKFQSIIIFQNFLFYMSSSKLIFLIS